MGRVNFYRVHRQDPSAQPSKGDQGVGCEALRLGTFFTFPSGEWWSLFLPIVIERSPNDAKKKFLLAVVR